MCFRTSLRLEGEAEGWHSYDALLESADDFERFPEGDGDDLTMILFTSGTTSFPKGVMLTHDSFSSYILSTVTPADPDEEDTNILTVPLYHIAGVQVGDGGDFRRSDAVDTAAIRGEAVDGAC